MLDQVDLDLAVLGNHDCSGGAAAVIATLFGGFAESLGAFYVPQGSMPRNALLPRQAGASLGLPYSDALHFWCITATCEAAASREFRLGLDRFGLRTRGAILNSL